MYKIIAYEKLGELINTLKPNKQQLVLVGGCFDILHLGHVRFLTEAKKYGTLIVALESDETLVKFKGESRPIHKQAERAEVLAALTCVDFVVLLPEFGSDDDYLHLTQEIKPEVVAVTEGDPQLNNKKKHIQAVGGKVIIIPKITTPSTTQLAKLLRLES
ncbi:glycerol-3-phosphate cytidylyltransferase [Candidatus Microgenomates bacterium]|nr:MAG: glycerol-3-phosphate cytidylyltransferase [Candidatus Microgenomates bacterium]